MRNTSKFDLSIVLNVHREANAMHPTLRSIHRSLTYAIQKGIAVEVVVVLDNSDKGTIEYVTEWFSEHMQNIPHAMIDVSNGDLGQSRNDGVTKSRGKIIGTVDADDLFSENLFFSAFTYLENKKDTIAHPEYVISFDAHHSLWKPKNSTDPTFSKAGLVEYNPWPSLSFASAKIRQEYPYIATKVGEGFGPEDWQWNLETLQRGIEHVTIPGTAYFYRKKHVGSLATAHSTSASVLARVDILSHSEGYGEFDRVTEEATEIPRPTSSPAQLLSVVPRYLLVTAAKSITPILSRRTRTRNFEQHMRAAFRELFSVSAPQAQPSSEAAKVPSWLIEEWAAQNKLEHKLFPEPEVVSALREYAPEPSEYAKQYWLLMKQTYLDADYVFMVPSIDTGGADIVTLNYLAAILKLRPKSKIVVLLTELRGNSLRHLLPAGVVAIQLSDEFHKLSFGQQTRLLATFLIQSRAKRLHVNNSTHGYRTLIEYGQPLGKNLKIFMSLFGPDRLKDGRRVHALLDNVQFAKYITKVFTDNQQTIDDFREWMGYSRELFTVHYQPFRATEGKIPSRPLPKGFDHANPLRILWAARMDREKHPELLVQIAELCVVKKLPVEFEAYGKPVLDDERYLADIIASPAIEYRGSFSGGLSSLPLEHYHLFLMTSEYEGMPNTLLEAVAGGLPVMAPLVGGIKELINNRTGYGMEVYNDKAEYVTTIQEIINDPQNLSNRAGEALNLVKKRHSQEAFMATIAKEKGYID